MSISKNIIQSKTENLIYLQLGVLWIYDDNVLFINDSAKKTLRINNKATLNNIDITNLFKPNLLGKIKKQYLVLIKQKNKKVANLSLDIEGKNNGKTKAALSIVSIQNKKILQISFNPVFEIQKEKEIKKNSTSVSLKSFRYKKEQLKTLFETSDHLIWMVNKKFELTDFNENFRKLLELKYNLKIEIGFNISQLLEKGSKEYSKYWHTKYSKAFEGLNLVFIKEDYIHKKVYKKIFINPIVDEDNLINEICCVAHDITDSFLKEKKISDQKNRLTAIFDSSLHYVWSIDKKERLTSFNKNYFDLVTNLYGTQPYLGLVIDRGELRHDKQYTSTLNNNYQKAFKGIPTNFELETFDQENKKIYLEVFLNPIFEKNKIVEISGIAHNITEKKNVHQKMEISLKEKEVLLREVHHRVKNNMQVISSILNLQSFYVKDEYALSLLKESQNRISTMATVHESLYQNNNFSSVNFSDYLKKLIRNIISSYTFAAESLELKQEIEEIALPLDLAIPLGLIINELITNAIKHAFPNSKKGSIIISLKSDNNYVHLELSDDGIGLQKNFSIENSQSLGLQLVSTLMEQIDAKHKVISNTNQGTKYNISFLI